MPLRIAVAAAALVILESCKPSITDKEVQPTSVAKAETAARAPRSDPRVIYELREKCGRDSRDWFKHFYGDGATTTQDFQGTTNYSNHYNAEQNRCFALVGTTGFSHDTKTHKLVVSDARGLIDVSENKDIGNYFMFHGENAPAQCTVASQDCSSQAEWEQLVAPYMER